MSISTFTREEMERDDNKERRRVEISVGNPFAYISNRANRWKSRWRISNFKRQFFRSPSNYSFPFLSKRERGGASHATFVVRFKYWPSTRGYAWYPGVRLKYWNKILVYTPLFEFSPASPPPPPSCFAAFFLLHARHFPPLVVSILFRSTAISHYLGKILRWTTDFVGRNRSLSLVRFLYV